MPNQPSNRFTDMFEKTGVAERKPKSRKAIDFGASLGDDEGINETFKSLHSVPPALKTVDEAPTPPPATSKGPGKSPDTLSQPAAADNPEIQAVTGTAGSAAQDSSSPSAARATASEPRPSDGLIGGTSHRQTVTPSDSSTVRQFNRLTVGRLDGHTVGQSDIAMRQAHRAEVPQTYYQTPVPIDVLTLSYNQACILEYLCDAGGLTSYRDIHVHTSIKMPSARDAIARLVTKGFMSSPETQRNASFQGFSYVLNKVMCDHFLAAGGLERKNYQTGHQTVRQSDNQTVEQSNRLSPHSSSEVSSETKPTTTTPPSDPQTVSPSDVPAIRPSDTGDFVLAGPESAYWEDIGLQERQALKWCEDFEVRPADMRQQLAWARWDLVQNGKESDVTKDPISWFFGCLRKTAGCYPRPENYQSPAELRARQLKLQQDKDAEARSAVVSAEAGEDFQRLMSDPQSSGYIELYEQVSEFAREQGGFCLELAMKDIFLEKKGLNKTDGCK